MKMRPQTFEEYVGFGSRELRQRTIDAGCKTVAEMVDWMEKIYGDRSQREQNNFYVRSKFWRPGD